MELENEKTESVNENETKENNSVDEFQEYVIDPIHKWWLFYFCSVIVQISLPSLTLEQEFFSI